MDEVWDVVEVKLTELNRDMFEIVLNIWILSHALMFEIKSYIANDDEELVQYLNKLIDGSTRW